MALISCAECGREFSDRAAACPQCAAPIDVARSDSKGASMPRFAHGGRLERRSHNEILIRAPGEQAFEHVRDALALMVDSFRVSTTPLSISADLQVEQPPASAKIRVLFKIPDSTTTVVRIEETSEPGGSSMAAHKAIELVAKGIMEHPGESFRGKPDVITNSGVDAASVCYDDRHAAIEMKTQVSLLPVLMVISAVTLAAAVGYAVLEPKHTGSPQKPPVERVTATAGGAIPSSSASEGDVKEMKPTEKYCSKATGLSQGFSEWAASRMKVSVSSVSLLSASSAGSSGCRIRVDTPKGPQSCLGGAVYSDGRRFWIGGYCY